MHLVYIDDSRDPQLCVFSALIIPAGIWHSTFQRVKRFRRRLRQKYGIYVAKELHAWKFLGGKGQIADRPLTKTARADAFRDWLTGLAALEDVRLMNAVFSKRADERAFERLLNRINRTMQADDSHALIICDEGKEKAYTALARRMAVHNPIPSRFGGWGGEKRASRNIPLDRIVEDPFFKDSAKSYFIQSVDFCAFALLRQENPVASKTALGIDTAFDLLEPIVFRAANRKDSRGIIRP